MVRWSEINWKSFVIAGAAANFCKAMTYLATGHNPTNNGAGLLPNADPTVQVIAGIFVFIFVGQGLYELFWVGFFSKVDWPYPIHVALAGLAQAYLSYIIMPWFGGPFMYGDLVDTLLIYCTYCAVIKWLYKPKETAGAVG